MRAENNRFKSNEQKQCPTPLQTPPTNWCGCPMTRLDFCPFDWYTPTLHPPPHPPLNTNILPFLYSSPLKNTGLCLKNSCNPSTLN